MTLSSLLKPHDLSALEPAVMVARRLKVDDMIVVVLKVKR